MDPDRTAAPVEGGNSLDQDISPLSHLDGALRALLDRVRSHAEAGRASLFLRDPKTGEAVTRVAHLDEIEEIRVPPGLGIVGAVLQRDQPLCWPGGPEVPSPQALDGVGYAPRSIVAVPVRLEGAAVGVLELLDCELSDRVVQRALRIADRMAIVLGRSSLAAQLRPRGERQAGLLYTAEGIIGGSPALAAAFERVARVAETEAAVLLTGETGTGKELFARAIHANSRRREGGLVKVDCGALPENILENELFGHERGAFTGAAGPQAGRLEQAHGGTLFLDEVGELSLSAQTRLLRVLEDRVVQRLGGGKPRTVDFRLVAATHRDLAGMTRKGQFRTDLYHRLQVVRVHLPPLRERGADDILRLVEHFADAHGRRHGRPVRHIPRLSQERLLSYEWPGNVRELSHAVESAVVLSPDGVLRAELFLLESSAYHDPQGPQGHPFSDEPSLAELERRYLDWLLRRHQGQKAAVAEIAGIGRTTLWRKIREAGLE